MTPLQVVEPKYNTTFKIPDRARISRQLNNFDRYELESQAKASRIEDKVNKKDKNYDKWCKEMRIAEKSRLQDVSASMQVFNNRKKLIHDRIHDEE